MKQGSSRIKSTTDFMKRWGGLAFVMAALVIGGPAVVFGFSLGGQTISTGGYLKQGVQFGVAGDEPATQDGFQQAITEMLLELKYEPKSDLSFFVSGKLNIDNAYWVLTDDDEWDEKGFKKAKDDLQFLSSWDDVLFEAHVTWRPNYDWVIRAGKQIIQWGEMDFSAITSIINPSDNRRGLTDVEFEATLIPITMLKVNYFPQIETSVVTNVNIEFLWNPNLHFRHDEGYNEVTVGKMGIWAPWLGFSTAGLDESLRFDEPDTWSEGQEFGLRLGADIATIYCQLMAWYGIAGTAVNTVFDFSPDFTTIIQEGFYPRERMLGGSVSRTVPLRISWLGGVEPLIRGEIAYFKDLEIAPNYEKDQLNFGVGIDWKVKIPWINPSYMIFIEPEYERYKSLDTPGEDVDDLVSIYVDTRYYNTKIHPWFYWGHSTETGADYINAAINYYYSHKWGFRVQCFFGDGRTGVSDFYNDADNVSFTVSYKF